MYTILNELGMKDEPAPEKPASLMGGTAFDGLVIPGAMRSDKPKKTVSGLQSGQSLSGISAEPEWKKWEGKGGGEIVDKKVNYRSTPLAPTVSDVATYESPAAQPAAQAPAGMPQMTVGPQQGVTSWNVDPNHTVAKQLEALISADGPLMQQARTRAAQTMNARGGLNTTMGAQAGESALYDAAFPIASQDASTYNDSARFNADSQNQFARDANAYERAKEQANFNVGANDWAAIQQLGRDMSRDSANNAFTLTRDAANNAFTLARDDKSNAFTLARDKTNHGYDMENANATNAFTLARDKTNHGYDMETTGANNAFQTARDATLQGYNLARDAAGNQFSAGQNDLDRAASVVRDDKQIAAELARDAAQAAVTTGRDSAQVSANQKAEATQAMNNARTNYATQLASISSNPNMSAELKTETILNLKTSYNTIIRQNALIAGWDDPTNWLIGDEPAAPAAAAPVVTPGVTATGPL